MDVKRRIAENLIHIFLQTKRPLPASEVIKAIQSNFRIKIDNTGLHDFLDSFPDNFEEYHNDEDGQNYVKLITNLSLCELYCSHNGICTGDSDCTGLHICKFYILQGKCRFGGSCRFGHDLTTAHNNRLLRENLLYGIHITDLRYLLNLPENRTKVGIPKICRFYNVAEGCKRGGNCPFLHICKYYLQGNCQFNKKCSRSHDIDESVKQILKKHGIETAKPIRELLNDLRLLYREENDDDDDDKSDGACARPPAKWSSQPVLNQMNRIKSLSLDPERFPQQAEPNVVRKKKMSRTESLGELGNISKLVCLYYLRGKCAFGKSCRNVHGNLPYQWQYRPVAEDIWENVDQAENWSLELTYSDPKNSEAYFSLSDSHHCMQVDFSKMTGVIKRVGEFEIRRLSTVSSGEAKAEPLATDWIWYWIDDAKEWIQYGAGTKLVKHSYSTKITSDVIERAYLSNPEGQMRVGTERHEYILDFSRMVQVNVKIGTERPVRRRPVFVKDLVQMKERFKSQDSKTGEKPDSATGGDVRVTCPPDWAIQGGSDIRDHFRLTKITKKSNTREYSRVESLFFETMPNTATITSIERVENGELWMDYCFKKDRMQKKKGTIDERQLFHGTKEEYVDAICRQNFDFRLSGQSYGTRYGKGSYFALEAKYSDKYTDKNDRIVFVVKVLVGEYKQGESKFVRPPSKDPSNKSSDLFDSCVDDEKNPKIFVIFDLYQAYPEFVIRYNVKAPQFFL